MDEGLVRSRRTVYAVRFGTPHNAGWGLRMCGFWLGETYDTAVSSPQEARHFTSVAQALDDPTVRQVAEWHGLEILPDTTWKEQQS